MTKLLHSQSLQLINTLGTALHLVETDFVAGLSSGLPVLSAHLFDLRFVVLLSLTELLLKETLSVLLALPLALGHDLKSALVSILSHHALQFERVSIKLYHIIDSTIKFI